MLTQTQMIHKLGLMLQCVGLPSFEKSVVNRMCEESVPYLEMREHVAFFWAGFEEFAGTA